MKNRFLLFLLPLFWAGCVSPTQMVTLDNASSRPRTDEAFTLNRSQFDDEWVKRDLWPALIIDDAFIPSQVDDLDGDGSWDQLAFVCDLKPFEKKMMTVVWVAPADYPAFPIRTHAHFGLLDQNNVVQSVTEYGHGKEHLARGGDPLKPYPYQTDGPNWENDKMGFRHYFDGRNCRDVFGKLVPDMVLENVGIQENGLPGDTYHVMAPWGRDIMSATNSFGLGGLALSRPDTLIRLGVLISERTDNVDSTALRIVTRGPVRSIIQFEYMGWDLGDTKVDVHQTVTIWAGKYGYENVVTTSPLPNDASLITGIVCNFNNKPQRLEKYEGGSYMSMTTHDHQTYNKEWVMGMSLIFPAAQFIDTFNAPERSEGLGWTWCLKMKPSPDDAYHFNAYAAWEISDARFADSAYYFDMIDTYARNLMEPVSISCSK